MVIYLAAMITFFYLMLPTLWIVMCSFMTEDALASIPPKFFPGPSDLTLRHYYFVFTGFFPGGAEEVVAAARTVMGVQIAPTIVNSLVISASVTIINLLLGIQAAYSFARIRFSGSGKIFIAMIATRLLPYISMVIPLYVIMKTIGLLDTIYGLILIYSALTLPFTTWLLATYFKALPRSIEEAAAIDGCTIFQTLRKVVLPLSAPGLIAVGIFAFMDCYGEFIFALILTSTIASRTFPIALAAMSTEILWTGRGITLAATVVALILPIAMAVLFRRYVIQGLTTQYVVESRE